MTHEAPNSLLPLAARPPQIVAPAGGRTEFFAALNAGADLIYLGLKEFSARATAENFSYEDLAELVPLARRYGVGIVVTVNTLIKDTEMSGVLMALGKIAQLGVHAISVQDLGVLALARKHFPELSVHASTQMALHDTAAIAWAAREGIARVILARELSAREVASIVAEGNRLGVEVETFCHGSLCYAYSGLCLFGGLSSGRSGNRGRCAYPCREPFRAEGDQSSRLWFSMRDLDTVGEPLEALVRAGVHGLKIEGRKKDSQYVATVVRLYRRALDDLYGRPTIRPEAPPLARTTPPLKELREDLVFSFQRRATSHHVMGIKSDLVLDPERPTHLGIPVGKIMGVFGRWIKVRTEIPLERFDGLRVERPRSSRGGVEEDVALFSIRTMRVHNERQYEVPAGSLVEIEVPEDVETMPSQGQMLHKIRSADLKRRVTPFEYPPEGWRLRASVPVRVVVQCAEASGTLKILANVFQGDILLEKATLEVPAERPRGASRLAEELRELFAVLGEAGMESLETRLEGDTQWFVPRSRLKELKRTLIQSLPERARLVLEARVAQAVSRPPERAFLPLESESRWHLLSSCPEHLEWARAYAARRFPDRALNLTLVLMDESDRPSPQTVGQLKQWKSAGLDVGFSLSPVMREGDLQSLEWWREAAASLGITRWEINNIAHANLLRSLVKDDPGKLTIDAGPMLYAMNTPALVVLERLGIRRVTLPWECDEQNQARLLRRWPSVSLQPEAILFGHPMLFISENCPWRSSPQGCAGCSGHRPATVVHSMGEEGSSPARSYLVRTRRCRALVSRSEPLSLENGLTVVKELGVRTFRVDLSLVPRSLTTVEDVIERLFSHEEKSRTPGQATAVRTLL
jgi:putative protease